MLDELMDKDIDKEFKKRYNKCVMLHNNYKKSPLNYMKKSSKLNKDAMKFKDLMEGLQTRSVKFIKINNICGKNKPINIKKSKYGKYRETPRISPISLSPVIIRNKNQQRCVKNPQKKIISSDFKLPPIVDVVLNKGIGNSFCERSNSYKKYDLTIDNVDHHYKIINPIQKKLLNLYEKALNQ